MLQHVRRAILVALAALAAALPVRSAQAQLTTYTFSGVGAGSFNGTSFASTSYTVTLTADLANKVSGVAPCVSAPSAAWNYVVGSGTYDITGVSSGSLASSFLFVLAPSGYTAVGIGQCAANQPIPGLFGVTDAATRPTTVTADLNVTFAQGGSLASMMTSDAKALSFDETLNLSVSSTSVPEPATAALLLPGLGMLAAVGRRRFGRRARD